MIPGSRALRVAPLGLGIALATVTAFAPTFQNGFVEWDDHALLLGNPAYRGLGWRELRWMLTTRIMGHYSPLTWISYGLDYLLWGMNPVGYHLTSLLWHVAAALLLYAVARRLLAGTTAWSPAALEVGAVTAALFFAIHPLRVESVAWATERRDVLSGALFLATILLYLKAADARGAHRGRLLAASVGVYALALLSKSIVMTLPAVLLLLDAFVLGRLEGGPREWLGRRGRAVVVEKAPYLILSAAGAAVSYWAHFQKPTPPPYPWVARVATVLSNLGFYAAKTALPVGLSPLYETPARLDLWTPGVAASAVGVAAGVVLGLALLRRWPYGVAVGLYYAITLAPVSGIVHVGGVALVADRYSYLPCLAWALLAGAGAGAVVDWAARGVLHPAVARAIGVAGLAWLAVLGAQTWRQTQVWHDTESLWQSAVTVTPDCVTCRNNLAEELLDRHRYAAALQQFEWLLARRPDDRRLHGNIGVVLASLGRFPEAIKHYERELAREPRAVSVRTNLATALTEVGRLDEAVEQLRRAVRIQESGEATAYFRRSVEAKPGSAVARLGLMEGYLATGRTDLARAEYEALRRLNPELARAAGTVFGPGS